MNETPRYRPNEAILPFEPLAFGGVLVAVLWLVAYVGWHFEGAWESHKTATRQWLAVGSLFFPYAAYLLLSAGVGQTAQRALSGLTASIARYGGSAVQPRTRARLADIRVKLVAVGAIFGIFALPTLATVTRFALSTALVGMLLATTAWLVVDDRLRMAVMLGAFQAIALIRLTAAKRSSYVWRAAVTIASIVAWVFSARFTFSQLADLTVGATTTTGLIAVSMAAAFTLVLAEFTLSCQIPRPNVMKHSLVVQCTAIAIFCESSLRTDHFLSDWIPYHRSFWVGPADAVRVGGWLLWDIPSQYGFLSALSIAAWPAHSTWQALFEQMALALACNALIIFALLRFRRSGSINAVFAIAVTAVTVYSSQGARFPAGWRLYPQFGLRFNGVVALLGIVFLAYLWRGRQKRRSAAYIAGFLVWTLSLLWSFESAVLASFVWMTFVAFDLIFDNLECRDARSWILSVALRLGPFVAIPAAAAAILECIYRVALGHGPDWLAYFEFTVAYQRQDIPLPPLLVHGPVWVLVGLLIAVGGVALSAIRQRNYEILPVVSACWFAIWGISNYYIGEGFSNHVNAMAPVFVCVIAVLLALHRSKPDDHVVSVPVQAIFAPILILLLISTFGAPGELATLKAPGLPGYTLDSTAQFSPVQGEIGRLLAAAKVRSSDLVIYPASTYNIKLNEGLTLPFVRAADGHLVQQLPWLPISPVGPFSVMMTLPFERRLVYLHRYYQQVHRTGWLIAYHQQVDCNWLLPGFDVTDVHRSDNYQIGRCVESKSRAEATPTRSAVSD